MKIRSFLAFDIPDDVKEKLGRLIDDLSRKEKGVKWASGENMHVTMKFFGDVDEELLLGKMSSAIEGVAKNMKAARLHCRGIDVFPNWRYPRVIWAGFTGETAEVMDLQKDIEKALSPFELHQDKREFRLHLTVGRVKGVIKNPALVGLVEKLGPVEFGEVVVDRLVLYKSVLTKKGSVYTKLKEFCLES